MTALSRYHDSYKWLWIRGSLKLIVIIPENTDWVRRPKASERKKKVVSKGILWNLPAHAKCIQCQFLEKGEKKTCFSYLAYKFPFLILYTLSTGQIQELVLFNEKNSSHVRLSYIQIQTNMYDYMVTWDEIGLAAKGEPKIMSDCPSSHLSGRGVEGFVSRDKFNFEPQLGRRRRYCCMYVCIWLVGWWMGWWFQTCRCIVVKARAEFTIIVS